MKTLQIENTREIFFNDSKEQYLHFKKVWSQAVNSEKAKKTLIHHEYGTIRENGWLTGTHHLIYALLRGSNALRGFTPATSKNKLTNGSYINKGLYEARSGLRFAANMAKQNVEDTRLTEFLAPFESTITPEMIIKLDKLCPPIEPIAANYGKGIKMAENLIAAKITEQDLWECLA